MNDCIAGRRQKIRLLIFCCAFLSAGATAAELRKVIGLNEPAPGFETGAVFERLGDTPRIDAAGTVSLVAIVQRPNGARTQALYRVVAGSSPVLLFKVGDVAPGFGSLRFGGFPLFFPATPRIDGGRVMFVADVEPATRDDQTTGIWSDRFGAFARLFLLGDDLPNLPAGAGPVVSFSLTTRGSTALLRGQFTRDSTIAFTDGSAGVFAFALQ